MIEIDRHLDVLLNKSTALVVPSELRRAIQDHLIAPIGSRVFNKVLHYLLPQSPPARCCIDNDVLDVADTGATPDELLLNEDGSGGNNAGSGGVLDDGDEVISAEGVDLRETGLESVVRDGGARGELREKSEEALCIVRRLKAADRKRIIDGDGRGGGGGGGGGGGIGCHPLGARSARERERAREKTRSEMSWFGCEIRIRYAIGSGFGCGSEQTPCRLLLIFIFYLYSKN